MKEPKRKVRGAASSSRPKAKAKAAATKQQQQHQLPSSKSGQEAAAPDDVLLMASEPAAANLRAVMNAHGAGLLAHLGQQMNAHLTSLAVFEGASRTLTCQCRTMVVEVGKLLEALEQYQVAHADALLQATLLRRLVAEFAQHVYNSQALGITNQL